MRKLIKALVKQVRERAKRNREIKNQRNKAAYAKRVQEYAAENPEKVKLVWLGDEPRLFDISQRSNMRPYDDMRALFPSEEQQAEHARIQRGGAVILPRLTKK
jgi:hypothetical protein